MGLGSGAGGLISLRTSAVDPYLVSNALPIGWAAFLTFLIAGPWLAPGYIFGTDWPGPRRFDFPQDLSSSALLQASLAILSRLLSGEVTGKVFILTLLFVAASTAYRAVPNGGFIPRAAASIVYLFNPFVFGRLHYGQLFLAASLFATYVLTAKDKVAYLTRLVPFLLLTAGASLAAGSYWVIPVLVSRGPEGSVIGGIGSGDLIAYAAIPDSHLGLLPNLLGLYGFWAEGTGRFASMKNFVPLWPVALAILLFIGAVGAGAALKQRRDQLAPWVAGLLVAGAIALVLEAGISQPLTSVLVTWLDAFPIYRGMRDAGKWATLLALVYSQLFALGAVAILNWIRNSRRLAISQDWLQPIATGLLLAFPLYYGNGLLFGMHSEIRPSQYPSGWYAADRVLAADSHPGRTLFLPWHEYMAMSFVRNQNRVIVEPATSFFSTSMLTSADPQVPGIVPPSNPDQDAISSLVRDGGQGHWAEVLAGRGVKYVLLAREVDWKSYSYLDGQPGLVQVADYGSIVLYRNELLK